MEVLSDDSSGFFSRSTSIGIYLVPVTWNATRTSVHLETTQAEAAGGHYDCALGLVDNYHRIAAGYQLRSFRLLEPGAPPPPDPTPEPTRLTIVARTSRCPRTITLLEASVHAHVPGRITYTLRGPGSCASTPGRCSTARTRGTTCSLACGPAAIR